MIPIHSDKAKTYSIGSFLSFSFFFFFFYERSQINSTLSDSERVSYPVN